MTSQHLSDTSEFKLLLEGFNQLHVRSASYTPTQNGYSPLQRPIREHLKYGVINLDKTAGPSSHEVVAWIRRILEVEKTGHSGTLDPGVTGCLLVCLDRATRLVKSQQLMGKEYVCVLQFKDLAALKDEDARKAFSACLQQALATLRCAQLQLPPKEGCAVKRQLRVREIYTLDLLEFNFKTGQAVLRASCQAGTYMRTLCVHIGLLVGHEAYMLELRRIRSGELTEKTNMVTLHDVLDSFWCWKNLGDESYLRKVVMPLEYLLKSYKRIFVKDSSINALTYGAPLHIQGVLRYDPRISIGDTVVLVSTKGEAVALGTATMGAQDIMGVSRGIVSKVKRVIMDRDLYDRQWGLGPTALLKKQLIKNGQLDKYGGINKDTPKEWVERFQNTEEFLKTAGNTCGNSTEGANTKDADGRQRGLKK